MTQTSQVTGRRWSAGSIAGAIVWVLISGAVAAWLFLLAFWDGSRSSRRPTPSR
jgi:hypothetical protein